MTAFGGRLGNRSVYVDFILDPPLKLYIYTHLIKSCTLCTLWENMALLVINHTVSVDFQKIYVSVKMGHNSCMW